MLRFETTTRVLIAAAAVLSIADTARAQAPPASWLDRPLVNWNRAGDKVPAPPEAAAGGESRSAIVSRCKLTPPQSTLAERALDGAGWIPFWNFDQQLVREDVEIVGGMRGADGMCRPTIYNLFVFVGGRFAGVLSPTAMTSRLDSSAGAVRMPLPNITADFARYTSTDPLCCPAAHVRVTYRVERSAAGPLVVAAEVRPTR
jgi:LppP/LprE lipoprotein